MHFIKVMNGQLVIIFFFAVLVETTRDRAATESGNMAVAILRK